MLLRVNPPLIRYKRVPADATAISAPMSARVGSGARSRYAALFKTLALLRVVHMIHVPAALCRVKAHAGRVVVVRLGAKPI